MTDTLKASYWKRGVKQLTIWKKKDRGSNMMNPESTPFLILDDTLECQMNTIDKFMNDEPLETISQAFKRMGISLSKKPDMAAMERRAKAFKEKYNL